MMLAELQHDFLSRIAAEKPPAAGAWAGERAAGLAVYRHAYRARLLDCLRECFEKTWTWIGDEAFNAAAADHIETQPSVSWTLDAYGENFAAALSSAFPDDPEIAELAWLERAMRDVFAGPDPVAFDPSAFAVRTRGFAAADWASMRLIFQRDVRQRHVLTNCAAIWHHLDAKQDPPAAMLLTEWTETLVWRQGLVPCFRSLDEREALALDTARSDATFDELCATMASALGGDAEAASAVVGGFLVRWIGEGLVAGIHTGEKTVDQL